MTGDHRHGMVALLFTDLVGSTEMLGRLGEDAAEDLRRAHFLMLRQAVGEAGGEEVKSLGDGLMVTFPSSLQAVGCAVAMQQAVAAHNEKDPERALQIRVGIHLGEPVADDDDFFGTPVVVAKRLCDRADGHQILASDLVATMVGSRGGFRVRSAGRLALKGLAEPLPAVVVEWRDRDVPDSLPPAVPAGEMDRTRNGSVGRKGGGRSLLCPSLIGRDHDLEEIRAALAGAGSHEGSAVFVQGEPGVGKSRLVREGVAEARRARCSVLVGRAVQGHSNMAFRPIAEALNSYFRDEGPPDLPELEPFRPILATLVPEWRRGDRAGVEDSVVLLAEAVLRLLGALGQRGGGCLLVLEDLHWADPETLSIVEYLAENVTAAPVVCLGTLRSEASPAIGVVRQLAARP
jgi:class 3 adenylate cyclase